MDSSRLVPLLKLNDAFPSYQDLCTAVERYEKVNRVKFWIRDAKRLHRAPPNVYEIVKDHPELEYCSLKLTCIHGGKAYQHNKKLTARKMRGTFKRDCKAEIFVKLNEDKNRLVITRINEEHNHDIPTGDVFKDLLKPKRSEKRKFSFAKFYEKSDRAEGICLENIVKSNSLARSKNFEKITNTLWAKYNCVVTLQRDENDKIFGFFFQDEYMWKSFQLFPEVLLVDGTYTLQNIPCSIYVFSIENSLGLSSVVGVGVLTTENQDSFNWMINAFKEKNSRWKETMVVVTDRQSVEFNLADHFPEARTVLCPYHAIYTFKKDLNSFKQFNIMPEEVAESVKMFTNFTEADSEEKYNTILENIEGNMPPPVREYFFKKWHNVRHLWVKELSKIHTYLNVKLEDSHSRFRSSIASCKTFGIFIEKLFSNLYVRRTEMQTSFTKTAMKVTPNEDQTQSEILYSRCLTLYAFRKLQNQHHSTNKNSFFETEDDAFICQTKNNLFVVCETSCQCDFFTIVKLPCEHILAYRETQNMSLFDERLFSKRWMKIHLLDLFEIEVPTVVETVKTTKEKFEEAESVCLSLAAMCSQVPEEVFRKRMDMLRRLQRAWEEERPAKVEAGYEMCPESESSENIILEVTE